MKTCLFLVAFGLLATCSVWGQNYADFSKTLDSIHQAFLQNPTLRRAQAKLSHRDIALYNEIINNYFDSSCINSKACGQSADDICVRIRNLLHEYHYYILQHPIPDVHIIGVKEPEWKMLTNTMGIYNNGEIWFVFRFNPANNRIIWLSEIVKPMRNLAIK
jgi:hypothetical protein